MRPVTSPSFAGRRLESSLRETSSATTATMLVPASAALARSRASTRTPSGKATSSKVKVEDTAKTETDTSNSESSDTDSPAADGVIEALLPRETDGFMEILTLQLDLRPKTKKSDDEVAPTPRPPEGSRGATHDIRDGRRRQNQAAPRKADDFLLSLKLQLNDTRVEDISEVPILYSPFDGSLLLWCVAQ